MAVVAELAMVVAAKGGAIGGSDMAAVARVAVTRAVTRVTRLIGLGLRLGLGFGLGLELKPTRLILPAATRAAKWRT